MKKPVISYHKGFDPTINYSWVNSLTEINVITTKKLTDEFISVIIDKPIFLHVVINGMGKTALEPNIPTVKETFEQLKKLINLGFSTKRILVIINPIIPNDNGLNALRLLLRLFTQYRDLKLRHLRFEPLAFFKVNKTEKRDKFGMPEFISNKTFNEKEVYKIANNNIAKRIPKFNSLITRSSNFYKEYNRILHEYRSIINIDINEPILGIRELKEFGLANVWTNEDGTKEKLIAYKEGKPIVNYLNRNQVRCANRCILCPFKY